jgi:hypothetical protein
MRASVQKDGRMRFYNRQHRYYCGIDLHVKMMYLCIPDTAGQVLVHRNTISTAKGSSKGAGGRARAPAGALGRQP